MSHAEEIYERVHKSYEEQDYRGCLSLLDKNWRELERFAKLHGSYQQLIELRQTCRDKVIERQISPPSSSAVPRRADRKRSRIKRRRH